MGQLCDVMFPPVNYGSNTHVSTMSQAQDAQFNDVAFWSNSPGIIESEEEEESEEEDDLGALSDNSDFEYFGGDNDGGEKRPESGGEAPRGEGGGNQGSEGREGFVLDQAPTGKDEAKNAEEEPHEEEQVPHGEEQQEEKQGHDVQEETQEKTQETEQGNGTDRSMVAGKVVGGNGGKKEGNGGKKGVVAGVALVGGNGKC